MRESIEQKRSLSLAHSKKIPRKTFSRHILLFLLAVCNFIVHEKCVNGVVTPCSGISPFLIKNPVAHCWSEPVHHKRKFCTVCRKRLDEVSAVHCMSTLFTPSPSRLI